MASLRFTPPLDVQLEGTAEQVRRNFAQALRELQGVPAPVHAHAKVASAGSLSAAVGIASVEKTSTGLYQVTLTSPLDPDKRHVLLTPGDGTNINVTHYRSQPDTPRRFMVAVLNAATAALIDGPFVMTVLRVA